MKILVDETAKFDVSAGAIQSAGLAELAKRSTASSCELRPSTLRPYDLLPAGKTWFEGCGNEHDSRSTRP